VEFQETRTTLSASGQRIDSVAIIGMGYVGLPTALSFMDSGIPVTGIDINEARLTQIRLRDVDLPDRDVGRLDWHLRSGALTLSVDPKTISGANSVIICVPTPVDANLVPDLGPLRSACRVVVENATPGMTIILTSTTYVGCTRDLLVERLTARGFTVGTDIYVVFSPERIDPGVANHRPEETPRVVGGLTQRCLERGIATLSPTCRVIHPVSSPEVAEMTKLLENTFRAVNIALINEFADASATLGLDITEVIDAAATKPYGFMKFTPGPGVGGHCIPCDPHYLLWQLRSKRQDAPVIDAAMKAIAARPGRVTSRITEMLAEAGVPIAGARIHVVGVTFKPGVADLRESPSLEILQWLMHRGARVTYSDAYVPELRIGNKTLLSYSQPPADADLVVALTIHPGSDTTWLARHQRVLDASFNLPGTRHV
jgi:UDP-N-acetyl-D-glucosamine dehydrogenase